MAINNQIKMLQAVLLDENLMNFGNYTADTVNSFTSVYQAESYDNYVISTVAQIILGADDDDVTDKDLWKKIHNYLIKNI